MFLKKKMDQTKMIITRNQKNQLIKNEVKKYN